MPQSLGALYCHIVFSTNGREELIAPEVEERLYAFIGGLVAERKGVLLAAGGMPDHVQILVSIGRDWSVADLVRDIKSNSSRWMHETLAMPSFAWQKGYGAFSVSVSKLEAVTKYLAGQKEHHANQSFQDEYRYFLRLRDLAFDERFVWE